MTESSLEHTRVALETLVKVIKYGAIALVLSSIGSISLGVSNGYLVTHKEKARIVGLTSDGRIVDVHEIEGEIFKSANVLAWAERKAKILYEFSWRTVSAEWPNSLSEFMTQRTKELWIAELENNGTIPDLKKKKAFNYSTIDKPPQLTNTFVDKDSGYKVNVVEMPMTVVLDTGVNTDQKGRIYKVTMRLYIAEAGLDASKEGLKIGKIEFLK